MEDNKVKPETAAAVLLPPPINKATAQIWLGKGTEECSKHGFIPDQILDQL
jgi:hypothetical protein